MVFKEGNKLLKLIPSKVVYILARELIYWTMLD